jgi:hypothetical protein
MPGGDGCRACHCFFKHCQICPLSKLDMIENEIGASTQALLRTGSGGWKATVCDDKP